MKSKFAPGDLVRCKDTGRVYQITSLSIIVDKKGEKLTVHLDRKYSGKETEFELARKYNPEFEQVKSVLSVDKWISTYEINKQLNKSTRSNRALRDKLLRLHVNGYLHLKEETTGKRIWKIKTILTEEDINERTWHMFDEIEREKAKEELRKQNEIT